MERASAILADLQDEALDRWTRIRSALGEARWLLANVFPCSISRGIGEVKTRTDTAVCSTDLLGRLSDALAHAGMGGSPSDPIPAGRFFLWLTIATSWISCSIFDRWEIDRKACAARALEGR
jgi:hypothetical protein